MVMDWISELKRRCDEADVRLVIGSAWNCGVMLPCASVFLSDGAGEHELRFSAMDLTSKRIQIPFEHYAYLPGYEACWSKHFREVECRLDAGPEGGANWLLRERLAKLLGADRKTVRDDPSFRYKLPIPEPIEASIGLSSDVFSKLFHIGRRSERRDLEPHTLLIRNVNVDSDTQAREVLEAVGNAWLFSLDLMIGKPVTLVTRRFRRAAEYRRPAPPDQVVPPTRRYNATAMALWSYGRRSEGFPLLQFLAFYQVLEVFFTECMKRDAQLPARNTSVPPRLIRIMRGLRKWFSRRRRQGNYEEAQIRSVVKSVINADELRGFLTNSAERRKFYGSHASQALTKIQVPIGKDDADLRDALAKRLYKIRCRVVHTKTDDRFVAPLYPSAVDVYRLEHDLDAIEMLAQRTLSAFSRPVNWMIFTTSPI
jgi:hypothetical protein